MTSELLEAALEYASRGWPVFPCRANKAPYTSNGVLGATTDPDTIKEMWTRYPSANIGCAVGEANMTVVDFDPGSDRKKLEERMGEPLRKTRLIARTPRGGTHEYYATPIRNNRSLSVPNSASKVAPFVDIRSFHGYTLLPPSRTADGEYTWEVYDRPDVLPNKLYELCKAAKTEKDARRDEWTIEPDQQLHIDQCIKWLTEEAKIAIEGQGGDSIAYATAGMCKSYGLSEDMALEVMWEHWNPRNQPPWSADEFDHFKSKIEHAYEYNTSPPGNVTEQWRKQEKAKLFSKVVKLPSGREEHAGRFRAVDWKGMGHVMPPQWLIEDLIQAETYNILFGAPGTYKTFLAIDIALSFASAIGIFDQGNWKTADTGAVLLMVGEGRGQIVNRIRAWCKLNEVEYDLPVVIIDPVLGLSDDWDLFWDLAMRMLPPGKDHYKLAVVDTVGRAMQGANENSQQDASRFTNLIEHMRAELGCSILAIHHVGHEATNRARGSSVFGADADMMLRLDRLDLQSISATMVKQKDAPEWTEPRYFKLTGVDLGDGVTSLAPEKTSAPPAQAKATVSRLAEQTANKEIEDVALEIMRENPTKSFTANELIERVLYRGEFKVGEQSIKKKLRAIMLDPETHLHRCYDPDRPKALGKYRWAK